MEISNLYRKIDSGLYPEFYRDALKYFEYLRILNSNLVRQILVGTDVFKETEIPTVNGGSFNFKLEVPKIADFDEVIG